MEAQTPEWVQIMQNFGWLSVFKVTLACLLGGLIGLEREWRGRDAGFRTNMLIAMGSCLFTLISIHGFPLEESAARDTGRVAAGIVTGIGFLGAGAMFHTSQRTKGMTTAATVWLVAAIGMTVGVGAYLLAIFSSVLTFVILRLLHPVARKLIPHHRSDRSAAESDLDEDE
ncbi:MAG: MgtC/SapB family protein [Anaerolineae bacterium]|nr:MgtC/SapB family protein [Anaerolineae bacterium]